ncbi:uncharacterized protein A1O5_02802 [Cladophialophora psammophila CBS 110553]|uniref:BZIP domain-containing protein n=1 Tax=Cladophialophora psammophila CBS 110553 TaxID=1182543 RepID=W9XC55_9EURO|nr:uncharacterized protein A1O5_02802 [Cladophialophora psammophila CBS 110553]EXJ74506.1 hypothetical protein A1O5_02802 [Cladophialophora psammophila CBS 110553]
MNVPRMDNPSDSSSFATSELYLVDLGEFDNLDLLDDFHQFGNMDVSDMLLGDGDGCLVKNGSKMISDVEISAIDQPATSTSTDSEQSAESSTKMVSQVAMPSKSVHSEELRVSQKMPLSFDRLKQKSNKTGLQRRRAQNRASQRAFRERKEKHLRSLKSTLTDLGEKHQRLLVSYSRQSEVVMKLKGRIADLHAQIAAFSASSEQDTTNLIFRVQRPHTPDFQQFDAFSFSSTSAQASHHRVFSQSRASDGNGLDKLPSLEASNLPEFEDLLNLP